MSAQQADGDVIVYTFAIRTEHYLTQPAAKDQRGICICQDADYREIYQRKYEKFQARSEEIATVTSVENLATEG